MNKLCRIICDYAISSQDRVEHGYLFRICIRKVCIRSFVAPNSTVYFAQRLLIWTRFNFGSPHTRNTLLQSVALSLELSTTTKKTRFVKSLRNVDGEIRSQTQSFLTRFFHLRSQFPSTLYYFPGITATSIAKYQISKDVQNCFRIQEILREQTNDVWL